VTDDDHAISYKVLERGTPVHTSDGELLGKVAQVLDNPREHIFDGLMVDTAAGPRFVDAPEVARITGSRVTLAIDSTEAAGLPARDSAGGPQFRANPRAGRVGRFFGGGWRRDS
jgi:hypothetical protein